VAYNERIEEIVMGKKYIKVIRKAQDSNLNINTVVEEILEIAHEKLPKEEEGWSFYIIFADDNGSILGEAAVDMFDEAEVQESDWEFIEEFSTDYELKDENQDLIWKRNEYGKSISATIIVKEK